MDQQTLPKIFIDQVKEQKSKTFLMYKKGGAWQPVSWKDAGEKVKLITLGLMALGVEKGDRIAAISETIPDLAYCCTAIANAGAIFTGIYHTNSPNECAHVINDSGAKIVFAEDMAQCEKIIESFKKTHPLDKIIVFEDIDPGPDHPIMTLNRLYELGKKELVNRGDQPYMDRVLSVNPDDICAIIYTSGTTGPPKGVIDTNSGIIRNLHEYTTIFPLDENDRGISFLPMAHALELRNGHWLHIIYGFTQVYAESIQALFQNVHETGPTFLFTTPRFFEKHYGNIWASLEKESKWKRKLVPWFLDKGARFRDAVDNPKTVRLNFFNRIMYIIADTLFLKGVRNTVGNSIRWAGAGGAPMAPELLYFFRSCGIPIYEGYGLTEGQGMISANRPRALKLGTVGKPMDGVKVKFTGDGEILADGWIKGKGYWNNPEATNELFMNGWINTGDLGEMDEDGFLRITGRKKEILITSSGKNISPSYIENILKMSAFISQAIVFGEGKTYLTALVTINQEEAIGYARKNNITFTDFADLTKKKEIIDLIHGEIEKKNKELARIENIRKFTILENELSQQREELTPTFKIKRNIITEKYKDKVDAMYDS